MRPSWTNARSTCCIWGLLLLLLFLNWFCAQFDLGHFNTVVALSIAVLEMLLVVLFFMQVRSSARLTWLFVSAGLVWLMIMFDLTLSDYLSRPVWKKPLPTNASLTWSEAEALTSVAAPAANSPPAHAREAQSPSKLLVTPGGLTNFGRVVIPPAPNTNSFLKRPEGNVLP